MTEFLKKSALLICTSLLLFACKDEEKNETIVALNKTAIEMKVGETATLEVAVIPEIEMTNLVWSSDNAAVATVDKGVVTAIDLGEAIITARAGEGYATCKIVVSSKPATAITLDKTAITLEIGETDTLVATVEPEDATDKPAVWTVDQSAVATVDAEGVITAVGEGTAIVTATAGEVSATCTVTVLGLPKIGDYYYEDGTWSDGGLISIDAHGLNPVWKTEKPAPKAGKTVVGIVFQNDPSRIAQTDKDKGYTHGYVVAVKNAHPADKPTVFYSTDYEFASTPQAKIAKIWYANINGYNETMKVIADYGENIRLCPAFDITVNSFSLKAPQSSSGWFLPSTGELWDMVANLCGHEVAVFMKEWQTSSRNVYQGYNSETVSYDVIAKFNESISMIPADQKEELFTTNDYWNNCTLWITTCFDPGDTACVINLGGSTKPSIELMCEYIDYDGVARPILAF